MEIIIIGAGIAGLSMYLHLRKHLASNHSVTIYESHKPRSSLVPPLSAPVTLNSLSASTNLVGGGLGISPNGMRVLRDLDEDLHDAVAAQGFLTENFVFKGANGWVLGKQRTGDGQVRPDGDEEVCVASSRHGLWETLLSKVGTGAVQYKKVISVDRNEGRGKVLVNIVDDNGNEETKEADLVIGADGVKSVVRKALFDDDKRYQPEYTGQSGIGGFLNEPIPKFITDNKAMVFTFGRNGFFGYASGSPADEHSLMWWSTFETNSLPATENIDTTAIKTELVKRHKDWKDPVIQDIIKKAEIQSIYPTWVQPELPHWGENGAVLIGDAAHAMDPTTGQGASQALEDSQTLSLLLSEFLRRGEHGEVSGPEALSLAVKLYYDIRNPRVQEIVERGKKMASNKASVGVGTEYMMYFFLWLIMKFPWFGRCLNQTVSRVLTCPR
jgi:2-polyprenyl-6-methoxyphenol hydroxylase-like FAD-dependent oxidoreductase